MKKSIKTILCLLLLLNLAGAAEVDASRHSPVSKRCESMMRLLLGAIEMYYMDNDQIATDKVRLLDQEILRKLVSGGYLRNIDALYKLENDHGCKYYILGNSIIICKQHGAIQYNDHNLSPREQFELFCDENGLNPDEYQVELNDKMHSDISGSPLFTDLINFWPAFLVFPIVFFVVIIRRRSGVGVFAGIYLFGTCIIAFLLILSLININYFTDPIPSFRRFSHGSYPVGASSLSEVTSIGLIIWWFISLLNTIVALIRKKEFMLSLVFTLLMPLAVIAVARPMAGLFDTIVAMSFPLLGALLFYLMAKQP